jgi:ferritin-like metal-binding protein YciE
MPRETLMDLYKHTLNDLYDAEQQILDALPKMADKAGHEELRAAFTEHKRITQKHVNRLEQVFQELGEPAQGKPCKGMRGLLAEGEETMKEHQNSDVLDAALIAAAQKVEHYEMAAYGCARTYAETLGFSDQAVLLQQTLDEEGEADKRLTALAEKEVNPDALAA